MKSLFMLALTIGLGSGINADARNHSCGRHHVPDSVAQTYTTDALQTYLKPYLIPEESSYALRPESWLPVIRKLHRFNELVIFNEHGEALRLRQRGRCENLSLLLGNPLPFATDTSWFLPDLMPMFTQLGGPEFIRYRLTAVIFWNRSVGMTEADCPFEWARQLRQKFGTELQIVWVNTDVNAEGGDAIRERNLRTVRDVLSQIDRLYF